MKGSVVCGIALSAMIFVSSGQTASAQITYRTIALSGSSGVFGPSTGAGTVFSPQTSLLTQDAEVSVNASGQVVFFGQRAAASGQSSFTGLWLHTPGVGNQLIARSGSQQPDGSSFALGGNLSWAVLNDAGDVAFTSGSSGVSHYLWRSGTLRSLNGGFVAAPDTGGAFFAGLTGTSPAALNPSGQVMAIGNLIENATSTPPVVRSGANPNSFGLWRFGPVGGDLLLRQSTQLLSLDSGGTRRVGEFSARTTTMNGSGAYAVIGQARNTVNGQAPRAVFTNAGNVLRVLAVETEAAPDQTGQVQSGRRFGSISDLVAPAFNNAGHVAFRSSVVNASGSQIASSAIFSTSIGGTLREVVRTSSPLPTIVGEGGGEFGGVSWATQFGSPVINAQGTMAFWGNLIVGSSTSSELVVTVNTAGVFTRVARTGDLAVPLGPGVVSEIRMQSFSEIAMNSVGQMLIRGSVTGNGAPGGALFAYDPVLGLRTIVYPRQNFEVAPGDVRIVSSISPIAPRGGEDGLARAISDTGIVAFRLTFIGGSTGVFTAAIPTPGGAAVLCMSMVLAARRRRPA